MKFSLKPLAALALLGTWLPNASAQTYAAYEGWDYNIVDSTTEKWLTTNLAARGGAKIDTAPFVKLNYSGAEGADGSRVADVDRDGDLDIMTVYEESKELYVYENTSGIRVHANSWKRHFIGEGCGASEEAIFFDYNNDSYPDIICVATGGGPGLAGERIYAYRNRHDLTNCNGDAIPSRCWSATAVSFGGNVPQKDWYRLGGDMGSADFNNDGCPDLAIGSAGGEVGVLWCPTSSNRNFGANWLYERIWNVADAEVQKLQFVQWGTKRFLVWSVKDPKQGIWVSRYQPQKKNWTAPSRIVSDVYSMEFTTADVDGDGELDLVLPTRGDVGGVGAVRIYWGDPASQQKPWQGAAFTRLALPWSSSLCNGLRNENIAKGVAVGEIVPGPGIQTQVDIAVMGRGCPYAANGVFFYNSFDTAISSRRNPAFWEWRSLTNQTGNIMQDDEEQKWDSPQLADIDRDGDLDVVGADENGDWGDTFKKGICCEAVRSDPHDKGVGTVIFWNEY